MDEREAQLSLQLEEKINEIKIHDKSNITDRNQLKSVLELIQSGLSSNTLQETGNDAIRPLIEKIDFLEKEQLRVQFNWSPQNLYGEINNVGEVCITKYDVNSQVLILPPFEQQKQEIQPLLSKPLQKGEYWHLVHIRWFKQWKRYVGNDDWDKSNAGEELVKSGPIDNTRLLDQGKLRRDQVNEIDYKLVPEEAWAKLLSWYSIGRDSMGIKRRVVEYGKFVKKCKVEVYPIELKACLYPNEEDYKTVTISRSDTVHTLNELIREVYNIESNKHTRVYNRYMNYSSYEVIKKLNLEVQHVGLFDGQYVLLEVQNMGGTWPRT